MLRGAKTKFHPSPMLGDWCAKRLRQDMFLMDADLIVRDRNGNLMILEVKARRQKIKPFQRTMYSLINTAFKAIDGLIIQLPVNGFVVPTLLKWHGCHLLQFERNEADFSGKVWLDYQEIEEEELIDIMNFEINITAWKQAKKGEAITDSN